MAVAREARKTEGRRCRLGELVDVYVLGQLGDTEMARTAPSRSHPEDPGIAVPAFLLAGTMLA